MSRSARVNNVPPSAAVHAVDQVAHGVEYTTEFQDLDTLVNAYDAEGVGPLRKGERPFQWESVASASEALLARSADLRVAIWLLRACLEQRGVSGLLDGLSRICELLTLPEIELFPQPLEGEPVREAHAVSLAWLGSAALLHQLRNAPLSPNVPITIADIRYTGIVSRSLKHGQVQNASQLTFDDQRGAERVMIHAERDMQHTIERNCSTAVGQDRYAQIKDTCTTTTDKNIRYKNSCISYSGTKVDYASVGVRFRGHCMESVGTHSHYHGVRTSTVGTKTETTGTSTAVTASASSYKAFSSSCTGLSVSLTGISLSMTGISMSITGISDSIKGISCSLKGVVFNITGVAISHTFQSIALKDLVMKTIGMKVIS